MCTIDETHAYRCHMTGKGDAHFGVTNQYSIILSFLHIGEK